MATSKPKKTPVRVKRSQASQDAANRARQMAADAHFDNIVDTLVQAQDEANSQASQLTAMAEELASALAATDSGKDAKTRVNQLKANLNTITSRQKAATRSMMADSKRTVADIKRSLQRALAAEKSREQREEIRAAHDKRMQEAQLEAQKKFAASINASRAESMAMRQATIDALKSMRDTEVSERLKEVNASIGSLRATEMALDIAAKANAAKGKKKEETEEQRLARQLNELSKGYFRRYAVDPLLGGVKRNINSAMSGLGRVTGVSAIASFVRSEKARRIEREKVSIELQRLRNSNEIARAEERKSRLENNDLSDPGEKGFFKRIFGDNYSNIRQRSTENRQTRALEAIASSAKRTKSTGLGWADLALLLGGLSAALTSQLDKLGLANPLRLLHESLAALKGLTVENLAKLAAKVGTIVEETGKLLSVAMESSKAWIKSTVADKLDDLRNMMTYIKESTLFKSAEAVASRAAGIATSVREGAAATYATTRAGIGNAVTSVGNRVSSVAGAARDFASTQGARALAIGGRAWDSVSDTVRQGASAVRGAGALVYDRAIALGGRAAEYAGAAGNRIAGLASSAANSSVGQWVGKYANRLGNLGLALSTFMGVYEEANGKQITEMDALDLIKNILLDPMSVGRYGGAKFNQAFEATTGQTPGSFLYDLFNDTEGLALVQDLKKLNTRVNKEGANVPTPMQSGIGRLGAATLDAARTVTQSANTNLSARSIPDNASQDSTLHAYNVYAFGS